MSDFLKDFRNGEKMTKTPHLRNESLNLADKFKFFENKTKLALNHPFSS